jgi:hypothetical protein
MVNGHNYPYGLKCAKCEKEYTSYNDCESILRKDKCCKCSKGDNE